MAMVDAVVRLVSGVINKESLSEESFNVKYQISNVKQNSKSKCQKIENCKLKIENCLEYPQYTRPEVFEAKIGGNPSTSLGTRKIKKRVPGVLLSGNHVKIKEWRENLSK
jgi:tRNA G37 N-methylase TrmD